ncbi:MAG TPA: S8 family serine peptidase [Thermoanaerobaculia bacterium]|nr:S8 family serine peptidase [Thermoanaerobaculia bacterium]
MRAIVITLLAVLSGVTAFAQAPLQRNRHPIPGQYIVVLREGAAGAARAERPQVRELAGELLAARGGEMRRSFAHALPGFVARMERAEALELAADPRVAYVAEDGVAWIAGSVAAAPSWGLDRGDQRALPLDGLYSANADGSGVDVYVVDTGIRSSHVELAGRVSADSFTTVADGLGSEDCHGHGTHVAGTLGGYGFGVAPGIVLHPVRVLDCSGGGAISDVIAGVDWVTARYPALRKGDKTVRRPAVGNLSLVAGASQALDDAVQRSIDAGVTWVVAAGNDGADACLYSPARLPAAITVGATRASDERWSWSNYSSCVDLFAPGFEIVSAFHRSDTDSLAMTGTSTAAPHVAGAAALFLSVTPGAKPANVQAAVVSSATAGALAGAGIGSPNRLLYSAFAGDGTDYPPVAAFTYTCSGRRCSFDGAGSADDRAVAAHAWSFGDGTTASGATARKKFGAAPAYVVTLTVTDSAGQRTSVQREVRFSW